MRICGEKQSAVGKLLNRYKLNIPEYCSMNFRLKFNRQYLILSLLFFLIEVLIALYVDDSFIRPYFGDFLVVILIYCFVKSFLNTPFWQTALGVLIFSYGVETLQYFNIVETLGLQHSKLARIVIGSSFEWLDVVAYTAGIALVIFVEKIIIRNKK